MPKDKDHESIDEETEGRQTVWIRVCGFEFRAFNGVLDDCGHRGFRQVSHDSGVCSFFMLFIQFVEF